MQKILGKDVANRMTAFDMISFLDVLPNPDPVLEKLGRRINVYHTLMYDDQVKACMSSRKAGISNLNLELEQRQSEQRVLDFISEVFDSLETEDIYNEILDAVAYGYQPLEIAWVVKEGKVVPASLDGKPPEWFSFDTENRLRFLSNKAPINGELLPDDKFLCATHLSNYRNPYGISELSACFWPVVFKKGGMKFWTVFVEKFGSPWVIGKYQRSATKQEKDDLIWSLESMVQDAVAIAPEGTTIEIIESGSKGASSDVFDKYKDACNAMISKAILGQTLTTEVGKTGSYAASSTHQEVRRDIILSDARIIEKNLNELIRLVVDINFGKEVSAPKFRFYEPEEINAELAKRDETLSKIGLKFTKSYFQRKYNLDDDDFDIVDVEQKTPPEKPAEFSSDKTVEEVRPESSEEAIADLDLLKNEMLTPFFTLVKKAIKKGNTHGEMIEALVDGFPDIDLSELETRLERVLFISELLGEIEGA